ncbi:MAG: two-component hybrid sensor and regulator [Verrucomicrobiales bacterium]|nr:two-component hybrid sensor and regulator [Verrucomicrobiales bacterium]
MISDRPPPQAFRIFVVDDHADILSSVCRQLVSSGHTVVASAGNMAEALRILPQADCQVLLSDIGLPDGTGWELLRKVTPLLSHPLYAIAMSGYNEPSDFEESRKAGFRQHLVKPFRPSDLAEALKSVASSN